MALKLFRLFERQLNPARSAAARARTQTLEEAIARDLEAVTSLDADRILRAFLHVIRAIVRTNFWQQRNGVQRPCLSFKLDSQAIPELPLPRPLFEVFIYSPEVEAIHLRMAQVARGGIRLPRANAAIADFEPLASERVGRQSFFGIGYNLASLALHPGLGDPLAGLHSRQASVSMRTRQ